MLLRSSRFPIYAALAATAWGLWSWRSMGLALAPGQRAVARTLLGPGRALDPARAKAWEGYFLVADGRVTLAPAPRDGAENAMHLRGEGVLLPAWADAHVYLELEGRLPEDARPCDPLPALRLQRAAGVTALADLNSGLEATRAARNAAPPGMRLAFAGPLFSTLGGWQPEGLSPWDRHQVNVLDAGDIEAAWPEHLRFGLGVVYASVEHEGREGLAIPLAALKRLAGLARGAGLRFFVQAHRSSKALLAMEAGPDALVGPLLDSAALPELAGAMRTRRCRYIPSLSVVLNSVDPESGLQAVREAQAAGLIDVETAGLSAARAKLAARALHWSRRGVNSVLALSVPKALADAGVPLAFGTGSGLPLVFHGAGVASELRHLRRAGFSSEQILAMAQESRELLGGGFAGGPGQAAEVQWLAKEAWADKAWDGRPALSFASGYRETHEP